MPELFSYLLKINIAVTLFYFGYYFFLKKLTFYSLNRIYLIFSMVFSAIFPFFKLPEIFDKPEAVSYRFQDLEASLAFIPEMEEKQSLIWLSLTFLYWAIVAFGLIKLMVRLFSLYQVHIRSVPQRWQNYPFRNLGEEGAPFSFLGTIYLNKERHTEPELYTILKHEQEHTKGLHSVDVLLVEIWSLFSWFNPVSWLLKAAIKVNIEFIADRKVVMQGVSPKRYQYSLVNFATQSTYIPLVNQFSFLSLKARIRMMNKQQSSKTELGKYVLLIPIIVSSLFAFGVSKAYDVSQTVELVLDMPIEESEQESIKETSIVISSDKANVPVNKESLGIQKENKKRRDSTRSAIGDPLYVIDGHVQVQKFGEKAPKDLNPNNIESVTILKDKSATALYGDKGKNGVILVVTKKEPSNTESFKAVRITESETKEAIAERNSVVESIPEANLDKVKGGDTTNSGGEVVGFRFGEKLRFGEKGNTLLRKDDKGAVLYFIDGHEADSKAFLRIAADQIDSVHVIKGGNAIALYGEKAKNGVVKIITKK